MTSVRQQLVQELDRTPDFVVREVLDFLLFIKVRLNQRIVEEQADTSHPAPSLPSFLQFVEEIRSQIPREEWEKLPQDLSKNMDHYLYGVPKEKD